MAAFKIQQTTVKGEKLNYTLHMSHFSYARGVLARVRVTSTSYELTRIRYN